MQAYQTSNTSTMCVCVCVCVCVCGERMNTCIHRKSGIAFCVGRQVNSIHGFSFRLAPYIFYFCTCCRMLVLFSDSFFTFLKSMNRPVPLQPIPGLIYNIPPFVMSQRGRTNPDVWAIATAIYLIKGEIAPVLLLFMFSFL